MSNKKQQHGQYFTIYNPFNNRPFSTWYKSAMRNASNKTILEPFAGANNLINTLKDMGEVFKYKSFDIEPQEKTVVKRDTLKNFPEGFDIIITNPPYLAKNSAKRNGLKSNFKFDDLYKDCLEKMLDNVGYVAAIIPATFLHWGKFQERLYSYIMLTEKMFEDTETPVCLALFKPDKQRKTLYYLNKKKIDVDSDTLSYSFNQKSQVSFNNPATANLALIAFDSTKGPTIKFTRIDKININAIKHTSRNIVSISILNKEMDAKYLTKLNNELEKYREQTQDIFMTPFKGVRKDMKFRRRIMFKQARAIIEKVIYE